ncbi:MAG: hypothetical protein C5B47_08205 [Verrucomicrobia bacterium]|nr:MAG: hypothetical protein C5B47_08205 [Verrucomicrobiota bacterium]
MHQQHVTSHTSIEAVGRYFENLRRAYSERSVQYDRHRNLLKFDAAAVITQITLNNSPRVDFDSQYFITGRYARDCYISRVVGGTGATIEPRKSATQTRGTLNIQEKMGWAKSAAIPLDAKSATNILLPATPKIKFDYEYISDSLPSSTRTPPGLEILRELSEKTSSFQFETCGLKVGKLLPTLEDTEITVRGLGNQNRNIFIPNVSGQVAQHLKYRLEGSQGNYRFFPIRNAQFLLQESSTSASHWTIDLSQIENLDDLNYSITPGGVLTFHDSTRGPVRIDFGQTGGTIEVRSKTRSWRLDRTSRSLLLTQIDLGASEVPGSKGARLQRILENAILLSKLYEFIQRRSKERNSIIPPASLKTALHNHSIYTDRWVSLDRSPSGHLGTLDTESSEWITSGDPQLNKGKLLGRIGSTFYFSSKNQIWNRVAGHLTQPIHKQSLPLGETSQGTEITGVWSQNELVFISQSIPLHHGKGFLEAIYQLKETGQPELVKLTVPLEDFRSHLSSEDAMSTSKVLQAIMELIGIPKNSFTYNSTAGFANLLLLVCRDTPRRERSFWLNTKNSEVITLDNSLPQDAVPIAMPDLPHTAQTIFYYSDTEKALYGTSRGNTQPFSEAPLPQSTPLMKKLRNIKFVESRLQVESEDGIVYEIDAKGKKRIVQFTARWMSSRQTSWVNEVVQIFHTQDSSESVEIRGIQLADGTAVTCWYDKILNHFTVAPKTLSVERLLHLGLATDEGGAWIFQPNVGQLYLLPTFTPEAATLFFDNRNNNYLTLLQLSTTQPVLPNEKVNRAIRVGDGRVVAWTQSGLTLLLDSKLLRHPIVLAVNEDWFSGESNQQKHLALLTSDQNYRFYAKIDLPQTASRGRLRFRRWYDVASQKIITIPLERLSNGLDYVGVAPSQDMAYFGNQSSLIALSATDETREILPTRFFDPNRNANVLSLRIKAANESFATIPPVLAGVDTVALHGNINQLAFNKPFWEHHRLIVLDPVPDSPSTGPSFLGTLELNFTDAEKLAVGRDDNHLFFEFSNQPNSPRLTINRFFGSSQNHLTLKFANGLRRKLTSNSAELTAPPTKLLSTLPLET